MARCTCVQWLRLRSRGQPGTSTSGWVLSRAAGDILHQLIVENAVVVVKANPVNEYLGPFIRCAGEALYANLVLSRRGWRAQAARVDHPHPFFVWFRRAYQPLVDAGYLEIVYGGGDVGKHLCNHPQARRAAPAGSGAARSARSSWPGRTVGEACAARWPAGGISAPHRVCGYVRCDCVAGQAKGLLPTVPCSPARPASPRAHAAVLLQTDLSPPCAPSQAGTPPFTKPVYAEVKLRPIHIQMRTHVHPLATYPSLREPHTHTPPPLPRAARLRHPLHRGAWPVEPGRPGVPRGERGGWAGAQCGCDAGGGAPGAAADAAEPCCAPACLREASSWGHPRARAGPLLRRPQLQRSRARRHRRGLAAARGVPGGAAALPAGHALPGGLLPRCGRAPGVCALCSVLSDTGLVAATAVGLTAFWPGTRRRLCQQGGCLQEALSGC